jgi:hypothetical protein
MVEATKGGKKGRKLGRNAKFCVIYKAEDRRMRNKLARLKRHINRKAKEMAKKAKKGRIIKPDLQAQNALKRLS